MMLSSPLRQSTRLLRGGAQGAAQGNVNTRRNQARPQPYPAESPRTAAARAARSVAPENSLTAESPAGAAPSVSTVITSPNTRAAAARARGAPAAAQPAPAAPVIPAAARRTRAAPPARARRVATTAAPAPAPAPADVATAGAHAGERRTAAPPVMTANLGLDFVGEAFAQRRGGVAMQGGGATRRGQGKQGGGRRSTVARSADKFAIQKCVKEYVFPKQKFVTDGNLDFSNNEMSICRCMAAVLDVDNTNIENWWETARKTVKESIYRHRNNTIKKIKTVFQGNVSASVHFNEAILNF